MEEYVKMKQTESLKASGQVDQLEGVNVHAALELLCEQGQWAKALERARHNPDILSKYMAKYVTHLIKSRSPRDALKVYMEYGTPCNRDHVPLYRGLALLLLNDLQMEDFDTWSEFRNVMFSVVRSTFFSTFLYRYSNEIKLKYLSMSCCTDSRFELIGSRSSLKYLSANGRLFMGCAFLCE